MRIVSSAATKESVMRTRLFQGLPSELKTNESRPAPPVSVSVAHEAVEAVVARAAGQTIGSDVSGQHIVQCVAAAIDRGEVGELRRFSRWGPRTRLMSERTVSLPPSANSVKTSALVSPNWM